MSRIASQAREPVDATPRKQFSPARRMRVLGNQGWWCANCGVRLADGRTRIILLSFEIDHRLPLELGGSNDDANLEALCVPCHHLKTAADVARIAKARRIRRKEAGETRPKRPITGRNLSDSRLRRKMSGEVVPR